MRDRHSARPLISALLALITAFLLFQLIISPVALLVVLMAQGISPAELIGNMEEVLRTQARALLIANTAGQFLGIALVAYLFARRQSDNPWSFLRVRATTVRAVLLSVVGLLALIPITQFLGVINEAIPLPEWLIDMERSQLELVEQALLQEGAFLFNIFVLAVTPALCEELLFRGYAQRQAERALGAMGGILFSGIVFGLYHLRLSQIIPLTIIGLYLAYLAWTFRSLWPAIIAHLLFNGFAVGVGAWASTTDANVDDIDKMGVPWYLFLLGVVTLGLVVWAIRRSDASAPRKEDP